MREGLHKMPPRARKNSIMQLAQNKDTVVDPPLYESRLFYFWPSEIAKAFVRKHHPEAKAALQAFSWKQRL